MNLAFLRYFLAVTETGNFTRAAERSHVSQPALSSGIARLEEQLGAQLFERGRHIRLTPAGVQFVGRAQSILGEWRQAQQEVLAPDVPRRRLRLMVLPTLPPRPVAAALARLEANLPHLDIELGEGNREQIAARLAQGRLDAAITVPDEGRAADRSRVLFRERYGLAIDSANRLASRDHCRIADLAALPYVWRSHCEFQDVARKAFAERRFRPRVALRTSNEELAAALVVAGFAACFLPESLVRPGMAFVQIVELPVERRIGLQWRDGIDLELLSALHATLSREAWSQTAQGRAPSPEAAH